MKLSLKDPRWHQISTPLNQVNNSPPIINSKINNQE